MAAAQDTTEIPEFHIQLEYGDEYDIPEKSEDTTQPHRALNDWYLSMKNCKLDSPMPLPEDVFLAKDSKGVSPYVLRGWLNSKEDPSRRILVKITDFDRWAVDRSSDLRGIWVGTKLAWYWLKQPSQEKPTYSIKLQSKFLEFPPNELRALSRSQEQAHMAMRAKVDLVSNLCDVLLFDESDSQTMIRHSTKKPLHVWRDLMPDEELAEQYPNNPDKPFDYELLQSCPEFVREHLSRFDEESLPHNCVFMKGLEKIKRSDKVWTCADYEHSALEAEQRSARYPWGEIRPGVERIDPNWTLEMRIQQAYQKQLQHEQANYRQLGGDGSDDVNGKSRSKTRTSNATRKGKAAVEVKEPIKKEVVTLDDSDEEEDIQEQKEEPLPPKKPEKQAESMADLADTDSSEDEILRTGKRRRSSTNGRRHLDDDEDEEEISRDRKRTRPGTNGLPMKSKESSSKRKQVIVDDSDDDELDFGDEMDAMDYSEDRMKDALETISKALDPQPSESDSGSRDEVMGKYSFGDAKEAASVFADMSDGKFISWESKLLICQAFQQSCVKQTNSIIKKFFHTASAPYTLYETWRKEAEKGLQKGKQNICTDYLEVLLTSMRDCKMVKNGGVLEKIKKNFKVDWEQCVQELETLSREVQSPALVRASLQTSEHIRAIKGPDEEKKANSQEQAPKTPKQTEMPKPEKELTAKEKGLKARRDKLFSLRKLTASQPVAPARPPLVMSGSGAKPPAPTPPTGWGQRKPVAPQSVRQDSVQTHAPPKTGIDAHPFNQVRADTSHATGGAWDRFGTSSVPWGTLKKQENGDRKSEGSDEKETASEKSQPPGGQGWGTNKPPLSQSLGGGGNRIESPLESGGRSSKYSGSESTGGLGTRANSIAEGSSVWGGVSSSQRERTQSSGWGDRDQLQSSQDWNRLNGPPTDNGRPNGNQGEYGPRSGDTGGWNRGSTLTSDVVGSRVDEGRNRSMEGRPSSSYQEHDNQPDNQWRGHQPPSRRSNAPGAGRGRGRDMTRPAWMNQADGPTPAPDGGYQEQQSTSSPGFYQQPSFATGPGNQQPQAQLGRGRGRGRGRDLTKPAWMTNPDRVGSPEARSSEQLGRGYSASSRQPRGGQDGQHHSRGYSMSNNDDGGRGRGRNMTRPAWQTRSDQSRSHQQDQQPLAFGSNAPSAGRGRGRGRDMNLPAWMTKGNN